MKGLRLYLPPFAPDTSGAASVLYPANGLVVIIDAGGCAGNICGFDEPRWQEFGASSAVFSAGLRDMDAIMGRDDKLIAKIERASHQLAISFVALISTPVPAVIGTDLRALKRMGEKRLNLPILPVATDGTRLYDDGCSKAYLALFKEFVQPLAVKPQQIGVIGANLLDYSAAELARIKEILLKNGATTVHLYGYDQGTAGYTQAAANALNIVISPAGVTAAKYLQQKFGTPYRLENPLLMSLPAKYNSLSTSGAKKILIIQQQVAATSLRKVLREKLPTATIICATWFKQLPELTEDNDRVFSEESDLQVFVANWQPEVIIADELLKRAIADYRGQFIDWHHFAVSGN